MVYEIEITLRTLRREGLGPLLKKISIYFRQLFCGVRFFLMRLPQDATPTELVDFSFAAAGGLLATAQVRSEIIQLTELIAQSRPKTVLEIGTAQGGTLFLWCRVSDPQATIISIDLPGGIHGGGYPYWKSWIYKRFPLAGQKLQLLRGDSHHAKMLAQLKSILPGDGKVDFLFIDGDHTYEGVKADFEMYAPLVRPGGRVVFHDICKHAEAMNCQVDRFWQEIKTERQFSELVDNWNQGTCGIGVIAM